MKSRKLRKAGAILAAALLIAASLGLHPAFAAGAGLWAPGGSDPTILEVGQSVSIQGYGYWGVPLQLVSSDPSVVTTRSAADGFAVATAVAVGTATLTAPDGSTLTIQVVPQGQGCSVNLQVTVIDHATGAPLPGADVEVRLYEDPLGPHVAPPQVTDSAGQVTFTHLACDDAYYLTSSKTGYALLATAGIYPSGSASGAKGVFTDSTTVEMEPTGGDGGTLAPVAPQLPPAVVGQPYSARLQAVGGMPPYTWQDAMAMLPAGLTLQADGSITGTPTSVDAYPFWSNVMVTDATGTGFGVNVLIPVLPAAQAPATAGRAQGALASAIVVGPNPQVKLSSAGFPVTVSADGTIELLPAPPSLPAGATVAVSGLGQATLPTDEALQHLSLGDAPFTPAAVTGGLQGMTVTIGW